MAVNAFLSGMDTSFVDGRMPASVREMSGASLAVQLRE
jgi:hypothetical protein